MNERIYSIEHTGNLRNGKITNEVITVSLQKSNSMGMEHLHIPIDEWESFKSIVENFQPKEIEIHEKTN